MEPNINLKSILMDVISPSVVLKVRPDSATIKSKEDVDAFIKRANTPAVCIKIKCGNKAKIKEYTKAGIGTVLIPPKKDGTALRFKDIASEVSDMIVDEIFVARTNPNEIGKVAASLNGMIYSSFMKIDGPAALNTMLDTANNLLRQFIELRWGDMSGLIDAVIEYYEDDDYEEDDDED